MKSNVYYGETWYKLFKPLIKIYYKLKFKPIIYGSENIPKSGPIILCGNHRHVHDQYNVMIVTKRVIHYIAKDEYFKDYRKIFYKYIGSCIPVNRDIHDKEAKEAALKILNDGGAVGIFPEGTRNKTFGTKEEVIMLPFKFGAVSLAQKTGALIVPFGTVGEYNGKKGQLITRIGKPIDVKNMDLKKANAILRQNILDLMQKKEK